MNIDPGRALKKCPVDIFSEGASLSRGKMMRRHSPYNYAFNNPIFFIDPDGLAPIGLVQSKDRRINSSKNTTTGTVNYSRISTHKGSARGYKTKYGSNFLGGSKRSHDHIYLTQMNDFSGTSVTLSTTTSNQDLGIIGSLMGTPNPADISDSAKITTTNVTGQFFDANGNLVNSAKDATTLVVETNTVVQEVDLSSASENLPENVTVTTTNTTTTYNISHGKHGSMELFQNDEISTSNTDSISFDDASKEIKQHAFSTVKSNIKANQKIRNFHDESFKNLVDEIGNN